MSQVPQPVPPQAAPTVCYRHPRRETGVRCVRCDRPICPECMNPASVGFQCPECVNQGRRTQRQARTVFGGTLAGTKGYVTIGLIAVNVLVELLAIVSSKGQGLFGGGIGGLLGQDNPLVDSYSVVGRVRFGPELGPYGVADGEYYRLVTSMFVHLGPVHLLLNMWALWIIGRSLEAALGPVRYFVLYMTAGLGGSVAVYLLTPDVGAVGASGAIFGLFAALFVVVRKLRGDISVILPVIIANLAFSFLVPGISWVAHVGGLVTGAIVAFAFAYAPPKLRTIASTATVVGLLVLFTLAVLLQTHAIQSAGFVPA